VRTVKKQIARNSLCREMLWHKPSRARHSPFQNPRNTKRFPLMS